MLYLKLELYHTPLPFKNFCTMEKSIVSKILIVGCGLTGSVTSSLIKHEAAADVSIWEKEDHIGKNALRHRKNIII